MIRSKKIHSIARYLERLRGTGAYKYLLVAVVFLTGFHSQVMSQTGVLEPLTVDKFSTFFNPKPASELKVDENDLINRNQKNLMLLKGQIVVSPPPGRCLVITKARELPDVKVCVEQAVVFELRELSPAGALTWQVRLTNPESVTKPITWSSQHRLAQWIALGERKPRWLPIKSCEYLPDTNSVVLNQFNASTADPVYWQIDFPTSHALIPQPPKAPNLFIRRFTRKRSGIPSNSKAIDPNMMPAPFELPVVAKDDPVDLHWSVPRRNTFTMPAKNFRFSRTDMRPVGECRYQLKGAEFDEQSGWIECHKGYDYEVVMVNMTCSHQVKVDKEDQPQLAH